MKPLALFAGRKSGDIVILERNEMKCASPLGDTTSFASIESFLKALYLQGVILKETLSLRSRVTNC